MALNAAHKIRTESLNDLFSIMIQLFFFLYYGLITVLYKNCIDLETPSYSDFCWRLWMSEIHEAQSIRTSLNTSTNIHFPKRLSTYIESKLY